MIDSIKRAGAIVFLLLLFLPVAAQTPVQSGADRVRERYTKYEVMIPMRDGVRLFTSIYTPKDTSQQYPFLLTRTPYSVSPYGVALHKSPDLHKSRAVCTSGMSSCLFPQAPVDSISAPSRRGCPAIRASHAFPSRCSHC